MTTDHKKRKAKERKKRLEKKKHLEQQAEDQGVTEEQKQRGRFQLTVFVAIALIGAALIVYNVR